MKEITEFRQHQLQVQKDFVHQTIVPITDTNKTTFEEWKNMYHSKPLPATPKVWRYDGGDIINLTNKTRAEARGGTDIC